MQSCLIVDDSPIIRDLLSKIFKGLFFEVSVARDGEEALEVFSAKPAELIILDYNLPIVDGIDVLYTIRNMKKIEQPKIIFCTNITDVIKIDAAIKAGVDDYIIKPFDEEIIASKLKILGLV